MDPIIINILLGMACIFITNVYQAVKDNYMAVKRSYLDTTTAEFLQETYSKEMQVIRESLMDDVNAKKKEVEERILASLNASKKELEQAASEATETAKNQRQELQDGLDKSAALAKAEYSRMDKHFRESVEEDVTLNLIACAYAVVASNHQPRNASDSELTQSVIRHRKSGGPTQTPQSSEGLRSEDLN